MGEGEEPGRRGGERGRDSLPAGMAFPPDAGEQAKGTDSGKEVKPKLYLTRDNDGVFLWFALEAPVLVAYHGGGGKKRFKNPLGQSVRLPASWYGRLVRSGECRPYDPEEVFR